MELLNKLTIKNLSLNKKRTIVTIIGIILATSLITGVATLLTSFQKSAVNIVKESAGNYHYEFIDVPIEDLKYIKDNRNIENLYVIQNIGYSKLENSENEYKPYLYITGFSENAMENLGLKLLEGRFPKNENEIVISKHIQTNAKIEYEIGDEITLDIGKRTIDGEELNQNNPYSEEENVEEKFEKEFTKTYKIVGVIERPNMNVENYSAPGYTVITYLENYINNKKLDVYTRYKDLKIQDKTTSQILGIDEKELKELNTNEEEGTEQKNTEISNKKYEYERNDSLIRWENMEFSEGTTTMIYSVATVVILIIMVTSIFCIRNSFAISITEKIKQYGMLASIGATSKQIRKNVLYEAFILAVIGIPIGIISGFGAIFVLLKIISNILKSNLAEFEILFGVNWIAILISIILGVVTIYLSARSSAKKAAKISPIEAIRSNKDIKIKSKKIKSPKFIKKLFGIGGEIAYKNLKRNNKKYRTTVISIVVSVAIFIAMTSFMGYAFKTSGIYYNDYKYNLVLYNSNNESYNKMLEIAKNPDIESYSIMRGIGFESEELSNHYSEKRNEIYSDYEVERTPLLELVSFGEQEYERYIKELGLKYEDVKDKIILCDEYTEYVKINGESKYNIYRIYDYKKGNTIQGKIQDKEIKVEIAAVTNKKPKGLENSYNNAGYGIVSDEFFEKYRDDKYTGASMYIEAKDASKVQEYVEKEFSKDEFIIYNLDESKKQEEAMYLVIAIFLYGFITVISLIGVTNIFNTITTNMELRQKEFANLKSIGMTKKEFNKMIRLESIFYGLKSLIIGVPAGIGLSYLIYNAFAKNADMGYILPWQGILISIVAVAILIGGIMRYSLNKINKQNIIETIRKDNI